MLLKETEIKGQIDALQNAVKEGNHSQGELLAMVNRSRSVGGMEGVTTAAVTLEDRLFALELRMHSGVEHQAMTVCL